MTLKERQRLCLRMAQALRKGKSFFLTGHMKPDGDTVGSELAMASLLRRLGKKNVDIYNYEPVPESLSFLPGVEQIQTAKSVPHRYDVAVLFECNDSDRMGNIIDLKTQAGMVINIDHHLKHSHFGDINFVNVKASSNSEQLYYLFETLKKPVTLEEATSLYVGIMIDTGRFMHSNTNAETLRISSKLLETGVNVSLLCEKIYGTRSFGSIKLLGHALSHLQSTEQGRISYMTLRQEDYGRTGSTEEDTEEIVNFGLQIPAALVSILFKESLGGESVKISLRARRNVNVCSLAEQFGGGGHKYAAGCTVKGKVDAVVPQVVRLAKDLVESPELCLPVAASR